LGNRDPEESEVEYCRPNLLSVIKEKKPKLIIAMGGAALRGLYGHRCGLSMNIVSWRGHVIPDGGLGAHVLVTFSPQYVRRMEGEENGVIVGRQFEKDIQKFLTTEQRKSLCIPERARKACKLVSSKEAVSILSELLEAANTGSPVVAFDYETTGIKPDADGHDIYVASIAFKRREEVESYSFFMSDVVRDVFVKFLKHPRIGKIAHNHKFEGRWSKAILGVRVRKWFWDTMLVQHNLDNNTGVTGLKFQVAVRFGDLNYGELGGLGDWEKDAPNKVNSYKDHDADSLRLYNALDSWYTYMLYVEQFMEVMKLDKAPQHDLLRGEAAAFSEGIALMMDTSRTFQDMEENGMPVDMEYLKACDPMLGQMIYDAREEFLKTNIAQEWKKRFGTVNVNSTKQLRDVLYRYLGFEPPSQTENDEDATDKDALMTLGDPELVKLLNVRKLMKARGTYVRQIQREAVKGVVHTIFTLNIPRTFRSSSQFPNMQNTPVRDKVVGPIIRKMFVPFSPEDHIVEIDLKGAEVATAACYNQDPKLIAYVSDPSLDMHRDIAEKIYFIPKADIDKDIRYCGKNMFVFPQFYESSASNCAKALWHASGNLFAGLDRIPMRKWLKNNGVKTEQDFKEHIDGVHSYFWEDMFSVYTEWKKEWWQMYLELGYVDTFTGFRCIALMNKRQAINYPIQGDAFHLEAWIANRVREKLRDYSDMRRVRLINLIHDSLIANVPAVVLAPFVRLVQDTVAEVRKNHAWVLVPITAEVEVAPVGKSWIEKKPYHEGN
jgi:DNA polymerase I-like protein with 3'-5' exonuclease and polymerase domains